MKSDSAFQFIFEIAPRKIRELQIAFKYDFKRLIAQLHFRRQRHIRYERRFARAHNAADHRNNAALVQEAAIAPLVVPQPTIRNFPCNDRQQHLSGDTPHPHGEERQARPKVKYKFIYLPVNGSKVERTD